MKISPLQYREFKPSWIARTLGRISPARGVMRLKKELAFHEFAYDAARPSTKRNYAPQNINPNSFDVQRDRLQLMRESFDLEKNFGPAKALNRKYAMFTAPISYHPQTGDSGLTAAVDEYLQDWFLNCDISGQYDLFKMFEFGVMGANTGGDYGFAYMRPGLELSDLSEEDMMEAALRLPLCIQAVEPDRIGGINQNVVSEEYIAGIKIGDYGQPISFRVFRRSPIVSQYTDPVDVPADQFVHLKDPMRIDQLRPPGKLDTAVSLLRDMYETLDYMRGKQKLASALTVFTNSIGATQGPGAMDAYSTNLFSNNQGGLQQDIKYGQMNHMLQGMDIKFPDTQVPGSESQFLLIFTMKLVAMSYNLPYSFALDAAELGGVSTRLESEMAKAEFERGQKINAHAATKIKNAALLDATAKGYFPANRFNDICKGRFGFRQHPQPDLGKEASAAVSFYQNGLLNEKKFWSDNQQDPEQVAKDKVDWALIKARAVAIGQQSDPTLTIDAVFGKGPIAPGTGDKKEDGSDDGTGPTGKAPNDPAPKGAKRDEGEKKKFKSVKADEREHTRLFRVLVSEGFPEEQAHAIAYHIIESGKFDEGRLGYTGGEKKEFAVDISGETRDESGKWTSGGLKKQPIPDYENKMAAEKYNVKNYPEDYGLKKDATDEEIHNAAHKKIVDRHNEIQEKLASEDVDRPKATSPEERKSFEGTFAKNTHFTKEASGLNRAKIIVEAPFHKGSDFNGEIEAVYAKQDGKYSAQARAITGQRGEASRVDGINTEEEAKKVLSGLVLSEKEKWQQVKWRDIKGDSSKEGKEKLNKTKLSFRDAKGMGKQYN